MAEKRTIRVTGKGTIKAKPDMTRIRITLEGCNKDYSKMLRQSSEDTELLKGVLSEHGFEKQDVKTLSFDIDTRYESHRTRSGDWEERFIGYEFQHIVKVEFESDNKRLGKILYSLAHAKEIQPKIRLSYFVKDQEAAKNELIGKAVEDAKRKADVLTKAAGVALKEIQTIDYSWGKVEFEYRPMNEEKCLVKCDADYSYEFDIEPDDIEMSDDVTVIWGIA